MELLKKTDKALREILKSRAILTGCGLNLRSCGCWLLSFDFEGLEFSSFKRQKSRLLEYLEKIPFEWNLFYFTPFAATSLVKRISLRKLCPHCLENYRLEKVIGLNSQLVREKL